MSHPDVLSVLFGPEIGPRFLSEHWPLEPCWYLGPASRLADVIGLPCLQSPAALLELPVSRVTVQANTKVLKSLYGKEGLSGAERAELRALYEAGFQLYFHELEALPEPLEHLLEQVAQALGISRGMLSVNAFACIAGSKNPPPLHWDPSESILLQCVGSKRWKLARNDFFPFPTFNHLFGSPVPSEHRDELEAEYPSTPPRVEELVVRPGAAIFVPRGAWHCAIAQEEPSLHLDINIKAPSLSSEMGRWIHRRLRRHRALRQPLTRNMAPAELEETLAVARRTLQEMAEELSVADLVRLGILGLQSWPYSYRRTREARVSLSGERTLKVQLDGESCEVKVPARARSVAKWIIERDAARPFGVGELPPSESEQEILPLLDLLEDLGVLQRLKAKASPRRRASR
ncbi:cupin domain-containing protein [Hyalangium versicolor]|uniref:cupin domain-containing protein n=1 Tax=Hyalangium versicolor TaxID=2861190 RepID=UPI001CCBE5C8|nr:cupin domain-containing protein [Hyalangium versicolor]